MRRLGLAVGDDQDPVHGAVVLLAEDNAMQAEVVRRYIEQAGCVVTWVRDGLAAIEAFQVAEPDLVLLDVMMPGLDGHAVCQRIRQTSKVAILMLTARSSEDDLLEGLDLGADDYMAKPFSPRELLARVRTLLRRTQRDEDPPDAKILSVGDLVVDLQTRMVRIGGRGFECTPGEFDILTALAAWPGRVMSRRQLLEHTSRVDRRATERTVDAHVRNLRKKLEDDPARPERLLTVFGVGYKLRDQRRAR